MFDRKSTNQKWKWIIGGFTIIIGLVVIGLMLNFRKTSYDNFSISLSTEKSLFVMSGSIDTSGHETIFSGIVFGYNKDHEGLFDAASTFSYESTSHMFTSLIVHAISGYDLLSYGGSVFIDDMIKPRLNSNLLSGHNRGQNIDFSEAHTIGKDTYMWTIYYKDNTNTNQKIVIHIDQYCSIFHHTSCKIQGTIVINTPLVSGPISGKIQGTLSSSILK